LNFFKTQEIEIQVLKKEKKDKKKEKKEAPL